jgi:hypothetical protein
MTIIFPAVTPSEHPTITAGRFPHVEKRSTGGRVRRIGLSNVQLDGEITLTFTNIDTEQLLKLRSHWILARGTTLEFALPADLFPSMSSTTRARLMATAWKHKEGPKVVDICGGQPDFLLHSLEITFVAQPRRVASPVDPTAPTLSLPVVPVTAPGAHWRIAAVFAPGKAGISAISLPGAAWVLSPVWLPGAAGTPGNINAPGAAWAVSVEIGAGARTTPSAALNLSTSWATGKGSITGVAPGAAWTNNVAWATGKASVSLVVAPGAALAAGVAWAPGGASITGGTAPGALLALATAWQTGGAQGIGPGAAWSVTVVWVGGAGSVPGTDQNFSSVALLLPFEGANNSTTFTDLSLNSLVATAGGNAKISNAQSQYGGASASFDGSGDYIQFTDSNSVLDLPGDFTLEFWLYRTNASNKHAFVQIGNLVVYADAADGTLRVWDGSGLALAGGTISTATWQNGAITRAGAVGRLFVDGLVVNTNNSFATAINTSEVYIGAENANSNWHRGFIDDLRLTKGVCRYTSNFTPTGPHPTS